MGELSKSSDLRSSLPAVRNQGHRPTCLSFATSAIHECERGMLEPLSVESLHNAAKAVDGLGAGLGTTVGAVLEAVLDPGQCSEQAWPYGSHRPDLEDESFYVANHRTGGNFDLIATVQMYVADGHPVVVCLQITDAWLRPTEDGWIEPDTNDGRLGGHAVVAVGYDLSSEAVLVRNSWGKSWARDGHGWLANDLLVAQAFAWFVLDPT